MKKEDEDSGQAFFNFCFYVIVISLCVWVAFYVALLIEIRRFDPVPIALEVAARNRLDQARNLRAFREAQDAALEMEDDLRRVERAINELNGKCER